MQLLSKVAWRLWQCELVFGFFFFFSIAEQHACVHTGRRIEHGTARALNGAEDMQASSLGDAVRSGALVGTFFAPTNEAVAALLDAESIRLSALTSNRSLATQACPAHYALA